MRHNEEKRKSMINQQIGRISPRDYPAWWSTGSKRCRIYYNDRTGSLFFRYYRGRTGMQIDRIKGPHQETR
jgi:hypothetical protein